MKHTRILILAHAPLASAFLQCALHVFADSEAYVDVVDVAADVEPATLARQILRRLEGSLQWELEQGFVAGQELLILTDIFGATPANIARMVAAELQGQQVHARVVTGLNFPMLVRAITYKNEDMEALLDRVVSGGMNGVMALPVTAPQHQVKQNYSNDPEDNDHHQ